MHYTSADCVVIFTEGGATETFTVQVLSVIVFCTSC